MRSLNKKLLLSIMSLSVTLPLIVPAALAIDAFDKNDSSTNEYLDNRVVEVGNGNGEIDLSTLPQVGPPMKLELRLRNSSSNAVNVRIPELGSSFLVKPNEERVHYLSLSAVGHPGPVSFSTETLQMGTIAASPSGTSTYSSTTSTYSTSPVVTTPSKDDKAVQPSATTGSAYYEKTTTTTSSSNTQTQAPTTGSTSHTMTPTTSVPSTTAPNIEK